MRICFTSDQKNGLESVMSYHFGRCPYFVIVDVDENGNVSNVESISNPFASSSERKRAGTWCSKTTEYRKTVGEVPEWSKGTDCKSVGDAFGGSNPPLPTIASGSGSTLRE